MNATATPARPASDKQVAFLTRLLGEKDLSGTPYAERDLLPEVLSSKEASFAIDALMHLPRRPATHQDGAPVTAGYYLLGEQVVKAQQAKTTTNLYAKVLTVHEHGRATWEYAPGLIARLVGAARLTVEQAAEMGHLHGVCMVCGRTLTDPKSVTAGIGPVCAGRL